MRLLAHRPGLVQWDKDIISTLDKCNIDYYDAGLNMYIYVDPKLYELLSLWLNSGWSKAISFKDFVIKMYTKD